MPGSSKIADKRGNKKCKTGEVISLLENLSVFLQTLWWRFAEKSDSKTEVSNVERISSAILHLHFWAIFELIRRSNASIVTENKFEKSRKGRGVNQILLANGKIAEVIFSTLLLYACHQKRRQKISFFFFGERKIAFQSLAAQFAGRAVPASVTLYAVVAGERFFAYQLQHAEAVGQCPCLAFVDPH